MRLFVAALIVIGIPLAVVAKVKIDELIQTKDAAPSAPAKTTPTN